MYDQYFPFNLRGGDDNYFVDEILYDGRILSTPFIMDYLWQEKIWSGAYDDSGLLPAFNYHNSNLTRSTPLNIWLKTNVDLLKRQTQFHFIFHTSRCGSTLYSESLKRGGLACFSEPPIVNALLSPTCDISPFIKEHIISVALEKMACCARCDKCVVKTRSWNVLQSRHLRNHLKDNHPIFIHRASKEVVRSVRLRPPGWIRAFPRLRRFFQEYSSFEQPTDESDIELLCLIGMESFYRSLHTLPCDGFTPVDYRDIKDSFFTVVKKAFGHSFNASQTDAIKRGFGIDSKALGDAKVVYKPNQDFICEGDFKYQSWHQDLDTLRFSL